MLDNREILEIALRQSAEDMNASTSDFLRRDNVITEWKQNPKRRVYIEKNAACNLVNYGSNVVASVCGECRPIIAKYIAEHTFYRCFETPAILELDRELRKAGYCVWQQGEYCLPDVNRLKPIACRYPTRMLHREDFRDLYLPEWSNALSSERPQYDMLGIGAYDGDKLIGFAGCSADCETMWQIGIDVLPEYRRQGIAASLTSTLAWETMKLGKVPFYGCAWSNVASAHNAVKCGFVPTWVELSCIPVVGE